MDDELSGQDITTIPWKDLAAQDSARDEPFAPPEPEPEPDLEPEPANLVDYSDGKSVGVRPVPKPVFRPIEKE